MTLSIYTKAGRPPDYDSMKAFGKYWRLRMESAAKRLEAAKQVIIQHRGSRGEVAENTLREVLSDFLPVRCGIGSGFALSAAGNTSRQVDILIYDQLTCAPIYRDGALVVLPPESVHMAIEVKSFLNKQSLNDAMKTVASIKRLRPRAIGVVFAYDGVAQPTTLKGHLRAHCHSVRRSKSARSFEQRLSSLPDKLYVASRSLVVQRHREHRDTSLYAAYQTTDPLVQYLIDEMLAATNVAVLRDYLASGVALERPLFEV